MKSVFSVGLLVLGLLVCSVASAETEPQAAAARATMVSARVACDTQAACAASAYSTAQAAKSSCLTKYSQYKSSHMGQTIIGVEILISAANNKMAAGDNSWGQGNSYRNSAWSLEQLSNARFTEGQNETNANFKSTDFFYALQYAISATTNYGTGDHYAQYYFDEAGGNYFDSGDSYNAAAALIP